ncbi:hypothetical protein FHS44_004346 [Streptosporangium saharense]|uniref:Uncharacterized protein n=1 Tax=Streptosporangium saharense TaxID=1706840 RepID=A0A7W7QPF1_9ACTN|nr:hypothetical protein [Streptosporangium saharense]
MIAGMTYFRVKWRRLPEAYRRFLEASPEPGATLVVVDCGPRRPVTRVGPRHVFQHGALGGATPQEYEVRRYGSPHRRWDYPPVDEESPEAEWGFEPSPLAWPEGTGRPQRMASAAHALHGAGGPQPRGRRPLPRLVSTP